VRAFHCQYCGQPLYFENQLCVSCGRRLGYVAELRRLSALEPCGAEPDVWRALAAPGRAFRFCANAVLGSCNWLVPAGPTEPAFCATCRHNRTIPDTTSPDRLERWRKIQVAQHRLFDALLALRIPLTTRLEDPEGLGFDILYDPWEGAPQGPSVITGHVGGLITLNLMEADDATRERLRRDLAEPYRTLLGHLRHEVGHYVWQTLVRDSPLIDSFRAAFGDEREPYEPALRRYYAQPPADWRERFVSAYASSHPWEDFAETWAHYLHMVDTLETAAAFGVRLGEGAQASTSGAAQDPADLDPYGPVSLDQLIGVWLPLTFAVNSLNRSMGQPDLYPFLPAPAVIAKLAFVHDLARAREPASEDDRSHSALRAVIAGLSVRVGQPDAL
jgi:hypothetical protein